MKTEIKRIPLSRCKKCRRYVGYCPIEDLLPCDFVKSPQEKARDRLLAIATAVVAFIVLLLLTGCSPKPAEPEPSKWSAVELLRGQHRKELTEWELIQLAIVYTESKFRPDVTGKDQDGGCYQMTPIYVKEVNRVAGTEYAHEDVYDTDKAIEIFGKMQDAKNPSHDIDTAIYFHNKSANYRRVVLENLELIRRYEAFRAKLTQQ